MFDAINRLWHEMYGKSYNSVETKHHVHINIMQGRYRKSFIMVRSVPSLTVMVATCLLSKKYGLMMPPLHKPHQTFVSVVMTTLAPVKPCIGF